MVHTSGSKLAEISAISQAPLESERLQNDPLATARWIIEQSLISGDYGQSLFHAHEPNLHSMMLYDFGPQQGKIRMFFAEGGKHHLGTLKDAEDDLRCRIHDHRFNLAVVPILGDVLQIRGEETDADHARTWRTKYRFGSAILNKFTSQFTFQSLGEKAMTDDKDEVLTPGEASFMNSDELHSVNTTPEYSDADVAWLVVEGAEKKPGSILYSAIPNLPMQMSSEGLYVPAGLDGATKTVRHVLESMKGV